MAVKLLYVLLDIIAFGLGAGLCALLYYVDIWADQQFPGCYHPVACYDYKTEMEDSFDRSISPCDDLYDHVCNGFTFRHPEAPSQSALLDWRDQLLLLDLLSKPRGVHSSSVFDKVPLAYQACIRVQSKGEHHIDIIKKLFKTLNFEWPVLKQQSGFNFLDVSVGFALDYDINFLFGLTLLPYLRTHTKYSLALMRTQGFFAIDMSDYTHERDEIRSCITSFVSVSRLVIDSMVEKIVITVNTIWAIYKVFHASYYANYTPIADIQVYTPSITPEQWMQSLNKFLPNGLHVTYTDEILVFGDTEATFQYIVPLFEKMMDDLMLFYGLHFVRSLAHTFSLHVLTCDKSGRTKFYPDYTVRCLSTINRMAPFALAQILYDEILEPSRVNKTGVIYRTIRGATADSFANLSWLMTPATRQTAVDRVNAIEDIEGMPARFSTRESIEEFYSYLPQFDRSFIEDLLEANHSWMQRLKTLLNASGTVVTPEDVTQDFISANAFYWPAMHVMYIPGSIMQSPFISEAMPLSAQYGSLGRIIGRELSRAFNFLAGRFTPAGMTVDWYDAISSFQFKQRLKCLIIQMNAVVNTTTLGNNSIAENFAIHTGFEKAILGYQSLSEKGESFLGYTPDEMFFISSCFAMCGKSKMGYGEDEKKPPFGTRCNLPAGNSKLFGETFNCTSSNKMSFATRCQFI
ncbi:neprilysin-3-like [Ornithodoros turicata]|uniref:neprilysin-3-like n=1 Tax=Ornithodoros turicata TaxID=34597 RepID=UPI0031396FA4